MQDFFGVKIDTTSMTLEELQETRSKILKLLKEIDFQFALRKIAERKHGSSD